MLQAASRLRKAAPALALCLLMTAPAAMPQEGEARADGMVRQKFSGSAMIYSLPELTLVYPAGSGQDAARNRISAERRAAYLEGRHATRTTVIADVDFADEHRDDNLLVLGWGNGLVAEAGVVDAQDEEWNFLGVSHDYDHDLLYAWASPFDESKIFAFWSRIEPELDRYLVLPFFGSDWIVFEDYYALRFGRFVRDGVAWPPRRHEDLEADNRSGRRQPRFLKASEHYELYHHSTGLTDEEVTRILEAREEAWAAATNLLGSPADGFKIRLIVYRDSDQKEEITYVHDARHHMPATGELHLTKVIALDSNPHEDTHLIARKLFGPGYLTLLVEGLAVWVEQQATVNQLPVYASALLSSDRTVTAVELLEEETLRALMRNRMGFPYAGLFVSWLHETVGIEGIARAYGLYASDLAELAVRLGMNPATLESGFESYLRAQAKLGDEEATFRAAQGKAGHFLELGDYERAVPALEELLALRPDHLVSRYRLGMVLKELGRFEAAAGQFRAMVDNPNLIKERELAPWAWLQLGEVQARLGNAPQAEEAYRKVLELPLHLDSHERAREALNEGISNEE